MKSKLVDAGAITDHSSFMYSQAVTASALRKVVIWPPVKLGIRKPWKNRW
jgi:hypothetical protein